jgi:general secretion pathway protein D
LNAGNGQDGPNEVEYTPAFSINKQAGIVSVYANARIQKHVTEYLEALRKRATSQVLIEAKVLEVSLNDGYSAGVNWNVVGQLLNNPLTVGFDGGLSTRASLTPDTASTFQMVYSSGDVEALIDAISRFGTIHALASPRLMVLNNQPAVLNVAENVVYFTLDTEDVEGTDNNAPRTNFSSELNTVPEGVLISVLPVINTETQQITLQVRPTVTRITQFVQDPVAQASNLDSPIPQLNVQEIDSILNMRSGEVAILGGLLQDSANSETESVPVLGEVPVVGNLFKRKLDTVNKSELVIFLKATIVDAPGSIHNTDKELYRQFAQDRRPIKF